MCACVGHVSTGTLAPRAASCPRWPTLSYPDMPTYEYRCPNGHEFEHFFRKMSEAESTFPCPVCGLPAERLVSGGAGLLFKGSGFYITDYGKDGKKNQRLGANSPAKSESSGSDSGSGGSGAGGSGSGGGASESSSASGSTGGGTSDKGSATSGNAGQTPAPTPKPKPSRDE
jgi:putative FmdB family regulatory protein